MTGDETPEPLQEEIMSNTRSPLARFSRRFIAVVTEMNRAQNHLANAQHTPERY
jgi:hypothetical protein